jgi:hypothetical protein
MDLATETQAFTLMAGLAVLLLTVVTGGVLYLTAAEWRDRRRRQREKEPTRRRK